MCPRPRRRRRHRPPAGSSGRPASTTAAHGSHDGFDERWGEIHRCRRVRSRRGCGAGRGRAEGAARDPSSAGRLDADALMAAIFFFAIVIGGVLFGGLFLVLASGHAFILADRAPMSSKRSSTTEKRFCLRRCARKFKPRPRQTRGRFRPTFKPTPACSGTGIGCGLTYTVHYEYAGGTGERERGRRRDGQRHEPSAEPRRSRRPRRRTHDHHRVHTRCAAARARRTRHQPIVQRLMRPTSCRSALST